MSPTVQVLGLHGVWSAGRMDQHGLDLCLPHAVPLYPALQHLLSENPLALLCCWPLHPGHVQVWTLCLLAGEKAVKLWVFFFSSWVYSITVPFSKQVGFVEGDFELRHVLFYGGCGFTIMRCMSFALENCERKDGNYNILELLKYNFYLPFFYFGPIMTFDKFYGQVSEASSIFLVEPQSPNSWRV